jgi:DNA-binding transcriptional regulator YhcF (GntR family)
MKTLKTLKTQIADTLRRRIEDLLHAGALAPGDRLPSSRVLAAEFDVDPRVAQSAYRILAAENIVELRPRSGIFVRQPRVELDHTGASVRWLTEIFATAIARDIPAPQLLDLLRRALCSRTITVATVATTVDQNEGMCRELREDYALTAFCITAATLAAGAPFPRALQQADLIVTTELHVPRVAEVAAQLGIPVIVGSVRRDVLNPVFRKLLQQPAFVVVADPDFVPVARRYFSSVPGAHNIAYLVVGRDSVDAIPRLAPVYVTAAARSLLGNRKVPGRIVPNSRIFSAESAREILSFVVRLQLEAALHDAQRPASARERIRARAFTHTKAALPA